MSAGDENSLEIQGWRFATVRGAAMSSEQCEALSALLQLGPLMSLPEMVFKDNAMKLQHIASGLELRFEAEPALKAWAGAHLSGVAPWTRDSFDFTFCTDYKGSLLRRIRGQSDDQAMILDNERTDEKLPLEKLMQPEAILYYDRIVLYEDDVRDLGEIYLEVKIRVMSFGFLLLCRYYNRLDGKSVKLLDTRYYHEFGSAFIWRDHEVRSASMDELRKLLRTIIYPSEPASTPISRLDFSADVVYAAARPLSCETHKIYLPPALP